MKEGYRMSDDVELEKLPHLDGFGQTAWLSCLNAAATIAAAHNHSMNADPTVIDPVRLADRFYAALKARCPKTVNR